MKPIFTALAPNVQVDDAWLALRYLFLPWKWKIGKELDLFSLELSSRIGVENVFLFETGRTALEAILKCSDIGKGDTVLLQAFTCVAVPNSVLWVGAEPVYVDCKSDDYTMSPEDLEKKIEESIKNNKKPRALIIQHTFGNIADMDSLISIGRKHNLMIIEDCAHALGSMSKQQPIGSFGDASFFSFGRDKVISSGFGGAAATSDQNLAEKIRSYHKGLPNASFFWIKRMLLYPIFMLIVRKTYSLGIGKILLAVSKFAKFFTLPVEAREKRGEKPSFAGRQMPNAFAVLAYHQIKKLGTMMAHRKLLVNIYKEELSGAGMLRYTIRHPNPDKIRHLATHEGIFLGDWYSTAVAPVGVSYEAIKYDPSTCPNAEKLALGIVNLPTDINTTEKDAYRIRNFIKRNLG